MKKFKIRASACGEIMTNPRSKSDLLSKTAQDYIEIWMKEQIYNRKHEIYSMDIEKGLIMEDNGIDLYAEWMDLGLLIKNEEHFEDDFMTGTPDLILKDRVVDIKCSRDVFTFPLFETEVPKNYFYQAQVYMHLTGVHSFDLAYVLTDTPKHLIERKAGWKANDGYDYDDALEQLTRDLTFDDVPIQRRIKVFKIDYQPEVIEQIQNRVLECREYIKTLQL